MSYRLAIVLLAIAGAARAGENTVEQTRKNIRALQELPESQLVMVMNSVAQSLGVHCIVTTSKGTIRQTTLAADGAFEELRRVAAVFDVVRVTESPDEMKVLGIERIGDHDVYALGVRNKTYFFDVPTALLRRKLSVTETLLAPLPQQVDYDEYRDVDGAKRAFSLRTSDAAPYDTATFIVRSIHQE